MHCYARCYYRYSLFLLWWHRRRWRWRGRFIGKQTRVRVYGHKFNCDLCTNYDSHTNAKRTVIIIMLLLYVGQRGIRTYVMITPEFYYVFPFPFFRAHIRKRNVNYSARLIKPKRNTYTSVFIFFRTRTERTRRARVLARIEYGSTR